MQDRINSLLSKKKLLGDDLSIECKVLFYNEGSRAARWFAGFLGAGQADLNTDITIKDKEGSKISSFSNTSKVNVGFFGGGSDAMFDDTAEKTVKYIQSNLIRR